VNVNGRDVVSGNDLITTKWLCEEWGARRFPQWVSHDSVEIRQGDKILMRYWCPNDDHPEWKTEVEWYWYDKHVSRDRLSDYIVPVTCHQFEIIANYLGLVKPIKGEGTVGQ